MESKQRKVDPIKNGTVIDHIPPKKSPVVISILHLFDKIDSQTLIQAVNLDSKKMGKKDLIKIENIRLTQREVEAIALIAPRATIVNIENAVVVKKNKIRMPNVIQNVIDCPNEDCVTNLEKDTQTRFEVRDIGRKQKFQCSYCEKLYSFSQLQDYIKI